MNDQYQKWWDEADAAGKAAVEGAQVVPMVVSQHANMMDDGSPVVKQWYVEDGCCGFAWVQIYGNCAFSRWGKKAGLLSKAYPSGVQYWVSAYNQSMQKKEAYARAFAKVLSGYGVRAYANSRMD